jgi:molybdenum cofactor cytidylyltransferase
MKAERIAAIVLAAGAASRMGVPKQLLPYAGDSLVRRAAKSALDAGCDSVIVVLGSGAESVGPALAGLPVRLTENRDWHRGMGGSVRTGMAALGDPMPDAVLITLADQPLVTAEVLTRLLRARVRGGASIAAAYSGTVGVPALFERPLFEDLATLPLEAGCKLLLQRALVREVPCPEAAADVDTPSDYARLLSNDVNRSLAT